MHIVHQTSLKSLLSILKKGYLQPINYFMLDDPRIYFGHTPILQFDMKILQTYRMLYCFGWTQCAKPVKITSIEQYIKRIVSFSKRDIAKMLKSIPKSIHAPMIAMRKAWTHEIVTSDKVTLELLQSVNIPEHLKGLPIVKKIIKAVAKYPWVKLNYIHMPSYSPDDSMYNSKLYSRNTS